VTPTDTPRPRRRADEALLAALAAGHTYQEAATLANLSLRTVKRRMADPLFRLELDDVKREVTQRTAASLGDASTSAVATLKALLADRDPWVRLRSSQAILDVTIKYRETLELTERLGALEERAREISYR
jgi:hypothetical protein